MRCKQLAIIFGSSLVIVGSSLMSVHGQSGKIQCKSWQGRIEAGKPLNLSGATGKTPEEIYHGISCLLDLKGHSEESSLSGATRPDVSQRFGTTSVEVAALYYISYLFYEEWGHANAPFLRDKKGRLNSPEAVDEAYCAYESWFTKVKKVGLDEARKQELDPLTGSSVKWY